MEIKVKVWLEEKDELVFGPGRIQLLEAVQKTGSIKAAANSLDMSYRHAWTMIRTSEERLGHRLVKRNRGGSGGGGSELTEYGEKLLKKFKSLNSSIAHFSKKKANENSFFNNM